MKIKLNDRNIEVEDGTTLGELLRREEMTATRVATAVNDVVVSAAARDSHKLAEGDSILVIKAFYGG